MGHCHCGVLVPMKVTLSGHPYAKIWKVCLQTGIEEGSYLIYCLLLGVYMCALVWTCIHGTCTYVDIHACVWSQRTTLASCLSFHPYMSSGSQTEVSGSAQQGCLPAEASHWPWFWPFEIKSYYDAMLRLSLHPSTSQVLGLQACVTMSGCEYNSSQPSSHASFGGFS